MKTSTRIVLISGFILLLILGGGWLTRPKPVTVRTYTVDTGTVEATVTNTRAGEVDACQRTKMSPIVGGRIDSLMVREGDKVKAGQILMRLWNEDIEARLSVNRAQYTAAILQAQEACTLADNAAREAARQAALVQRNFVSAQAEEKARSEALARRAACDAAQANVMTASAQIDATTTEQQRTLLIAPFDGTIAKITGELGEYTTPSPPGVATPPALDLIDDSCLYVKAPMDEIDAPRIQTGQPVRITLDALPDKVFAGTVRRVSPYITVIEKQARTVEIEIDFNHPEEARGLLVGYSADAEIILATRETTLRIPTSALRPGKQVLVLASDGILQERTVTTGITNWEYTEILTGLEAGEQLVTSMENKTIYPGIQAVAESASPRDR